MNKLDVAVLGATGMVGQRFIKLLENHPWFRVAEVIGSDRSAGRRYGDAVRWVLDEDAPSAVLNLEVKPLDSSFHSTLVFSALPKEAAMPREMELAEAGHIVCTNASAYRMTEDVPILLPEVNGDQLALVDEQRRVRGWSGALVANSNCTSVPGVMTLAPLRQFGVSKVLITSQQALSGAGHPGVPSLDAMDNVIPYVPGEEEKVEAETLKMLGRYHAGAIATHDAIVSATCTRVPVIDGHMVSISVELENDPGMDGVIEAWTSFRGADPISSLPSAPEQPVIYRTQPDRPQTRRDRMAGGGMSTTAGRLRRCSILTYKYVALSHNTIRGAAGCSILNAEYMAVMGYIPQFQPAVGAAI